MLLVRGPILLLFSVLAAEAAVPMELYFSPEELVRIAGYGEERISSVFIAGQVACEACLRPGLEVLSFKVQGAKVAVACATEGTNAMSNAAVAVTDEFGNFTVDLPSRLHATPRLEKACAVRLLQMPSGWSCRLPRRRSNSHSIRLLSSENGVRTYTAGVIRLQHRHMPSSDKCIFQMEHRTDER